MTNFRLIFWWFCQGVSPRENKKSDSPQTARLCIFMGGVQLPFSVTSLPCENGITERPQTFRYPKIKLIFRCLCAATTTTAASGGNRKELLGQRPARRECRPRHEADAGSRNPLAERMQNQPRYIRIRCVARAMEASSRFRAGGYFFLYIPLRLCYS